MEDEVEEAELTDLQRVMRLESDIQEFEMRYGTPDMMNDFEIKLYDKMCKKLEKLRGLS